jgi:chorismate mutase
LIAEVSQYALNLNFDGLMIESHINPDEALSDARQQLTPNDLIQLLRNLQFRTDQEESSISQLENLTTPN